MRTRDAGAAGVLTAFSVLALAGSLGLHAGSMRTPGPGFFPLVLSVAMLVCSVALLVQALRAPAGAPPAGAPPPVAAAARLRPALALVALFVHALVMESIGFTVSTAALLAFLFVMIAPRRWPLGVAGGVVAAVVSYVVFKIWLQVELPAGPWGF